MRIAIARPPLFLLALALALGGCRGCASSKPPIHLNPNMDHQPKLLPQAESGFFADGAAMRKPVAGTVASGTPLGQEAVTTGKDAAGAWVTAVPIPVDERLLARGQQRFDIYCTPCHGDRGDGKGMLFQRAQVKSADLMEARFRQMPVGQLFDEVSHGTGLMPAYGYQVPVADRWAILAYLRQLQEQTPLAGEPMAAAPPADAAVPAADAPATPAAAPSPAAAPAAAATATAAPGGAR